MIFHTLNLEPRLMRGITDRGYRKTTEVQEKTLGHTLRGRDVAVQSQTGTGKTAAFLITLFDRMAKHRPPQKRKALIIVPTRELAVQIEKEARLLSAHMEFAVASFYGGVGYAEQLRRLRKGVDVAIGTPGRLLDLSQKGHLNLKAFNILVIDEADRLFDMGFLPDLKKILQRMPPRKARQNMLFSATLNRISSLIAYEHMNNPISVHVSPERLTVETISQEIYRVKSHIKMNLMVGILKDQSPRSALIFTNMKHVAFRVAQKLRQNGFHSRHLTGDLKQAQRLKLLEDFKAGRVALLVATDVAARGLHIDNLEMVINYDIPQDCENYVHRIGRTARAGNTGRAISLASEGTADSLEAIERFIGMKIPERTPEDELFATDRSVGHPPEDKPRFRNQKSGRPRHGLKKMRGEKRRETPRARSAGRFQDP
ncbi:MAG: DEAD/DEAH box helicase [Candidatus Aminicenantales bacterium]